MLDFVMTVSAKGGEGLKPLGLVPFLDYWPVESIIKKLNPLALLIGERRSRNKLVIFAWGRKLGDLDKLLEHAFSLFVGHLCLRLDECLSLRTFVAYLVRLV
jgi:hypothetical protein